MSKKVFISVLVVFFALSVSAQFDGWGSQSKVITDSIYSKVLGAERQYTIFLPKSYETETNKKYPILYLLHGMMGVNTSWFNDQRAKDVADQLIASSEACEMIIVSPNAGGNVYEGAWNGYFDIIEFTQAMRKAQIPCEFRVRDGGHTNEYWHSALYNCLRFVTLTFLK